MRNPIAKKVADIQPSGIRKFFDIVNEMVDMITASRAYEANVTTINAAKSMAQQALNISK